MGYPPLGPIGRRRLTRAVSELQFIDHAVEDAARERGKGEKAPTPEVMLAAKEAVDLYGLDLALTLEDDDDSATDDATDGDGGGGA